MFCDVLLSIYNVYLDDDLHLFLLLLTVYLMFFSLRLQVFNKPILFVITKEINELCQINGAQKIKDRFQNVRNVTYNRVHPGNIQYI